jgi:hypothetical protein
MAIDVLGENSLYRNAVKNCVKVLKDNFTSETGRTIKQYYDEDVYRPITPSIAVLTVGSDDELRTVQNMTQMRYTINIGMEVWYYHADLTEEVKRNEITYILWEINFLLKKYVTLNGFVPKLGVEVSGARWVPQKRGNRIYAAGVISLVAKKLFTSTTVI